MLRFESKQLLMLLWSLPILFLILIYSYKMHKKKLKQVFGKQVSFLTASVSEKKRKLKLALQLLVMIFLIIALARPQAGSATEEVKSEGVELMIVADVSESMMADDLRPSRLDQMKIDISKMIDLLSGNKIGIVAFAGVSVLLSPMTTDPGSLKLFVDSLSIHSVSTQGTYFKGALEEAKSAFERGGTDKSNANVTRVVLVLSDGEDQEPGALEYAKKMVSDGLRIFTIAYGTEKGAPIPQRDSLGYLKGYKKDQKGNTVLTTVNGEMLQQLASAGSGSFFFASAGASYLKNLVEDLGKLEKTQFESSMITDYEEKYFIFVFLAFIIALIEFLLGERRLSFKIWRGRFEGPVT